MQISMIGELMLSVSDAFRHCRNRIKPLINEKLACIELEGAMKSWGHFSIILDESGPCYEEIIKQRAQGKELEFRLCISYEAFLEGGEQKRLALIFDSLQRSVDLMEGLGVCASDRKKLGAMLAEARTELA